MIFSLLAIETLKNHLNLKKKIHHDKNSPVKKRAHRRPHFEEVCSHDIHSFSGPLRNYYFSMGTKDIASPLWSQA
jgi:hypothetical protein